MSISAQQVKELRDRTGAALMACKRALVETDGDLEEARKVLREKGAATARKKSTRETSEGAIASYVHANGKIGVLVEVACETDFVARSDEFQQLGKELAMQIAAMDPIAVSSEDLPAETVEEERELYREQAGEKPEHVQEQIIKGRLEKFYEQSCLLNQAYIRDDSKTVEDLIAQTIATLGENIEVNRFVRLEMGQEQD
ncbi:MAG: translation elongation factor Ts [Planctomycetota bacterium]